MNYLKAFRTNNGLLIINNKTSWFTDHEGKFRRLAMREESEYLISEVGLEMALVPEKIDFPVTWTLIGDLISFEDDSNYEPGLSSNGGKYSFTYRTRVYNRFTSKGSEWLKLEYSETSSGFGYDQIDDRFDSSVGRVTFVDTDDKFSVETYTDGERGDENQSIQRGYGTLISEKEGRGYLSLIKQLAEAAK